MDKVLSVEDMCLGEYLGVDINNTDLSYNPLLDRTKEDIENPHVHILRLMCQPEYFGFTAKHLFNIDLAPFQLVILEQLWKRKYPMLIASRGASKSFLLALYAMLRALIHQGSKIVIVGAGFRQAKYVFEYCENIWNNAPILRDILGNKYIGVKSGKRNLIDRLLFHIGESVITALPMGDGSKIRGQRGNCIIIDEFSAVPRDIYEIVVAGFGAVSSSPIESMKQAARIRVLKTLGVFSDEMDDDNSNQTIIAGTAYYGFHHFAEYWRQYKAFIESDGNPRKLEEIFQGEVPTKFNHKDFAVIRLPKELIPEGFMDEKNIARSKAVIHSSNYNMEYGACFVQDSTGFFRRKLIEGCVTTNPVQTVLGDTVKFEAVIRGNAKRNYFYGVDPASEDNNFAIVILEAHEDHRRLVYCWTTTRAAHKEKISAGLTEQHDFYGYCARKIRDLMKSFPAERIAIDAGGGGIAVQEALSDPDKINKGEQPIWPVVDEKKEQFSDGQSGLHILEMVNFADYQYTRQANHGLKKDLEDKVILFPFFDSLSIDMAIIEDNNNNKLYDTLEDCIMEIEELKEELATVVVTVTPSGRESWDTPTIKTPGSKRGRLRKDRYSALVLANMSARSFARAPNTTNPYQGAGGVVGKHHKGIGGELFIGPRWFTEAVKHSCIYGKK